MQKNVWLSVSYVVALPQHSGHVMAAESDLALAESVSAVIKNG